ncbi:MAG TPA: aminopeptidase N [Kineosporiaceae bacterium]|nr:aminopeptidase N [Kineosporiaceae bacterium]
MPGINLTRDEATARAELLQVDGYDVTLALGDGTDTFRSVTTVRFSCSEPGTGTFIDLIAPAVHEVVLNGRSLPVEEVVSTARIALPELSADNELTVVADAAYMRTGEGLHRFVDPVDQEVYLYSQFEVADARRVFACFDQPDLKATYTFTITAPDHWQVVSVSPTPQPDPAGPGRATWRFATTPRLSTYVTAIVAGPYHVVRLQVSGRDGRSIPLGVFCRASLAPHLDADNVVEVTRAGFAHFEQLFDVDYPFAKYDQLFVPEFNAGAMENAGAVTITETYVFRSRVPQATVERRALTILHELAHMWFGDLVTMRWWDDLWLNESFAEYASTRCQAEATPWRSAWTTFSSSEKSWAYRQDQLASTHPIVADIRDLADVEVNFDGITYAKGASVLKQLVHWVGADAFDAGLRSYFRTHAWGNTRLADLLAELATASGRDLQAWAAEWLQTAGVATLSPQLERTADGRIAALAVQQTAPAGHPTLRSHRLAIGCYDLVDGRLQRTRRVELDISGARTEVPELAGTPVPDLLLVNDDDLAYAKTRLDPASMATAVAHLADFADSLPRTLVWVAAWDMTRDAELGARDFVDLVLNNIASVDDPSVAQTLLRQLSTTLAFYVAPEFRVAAVEDAADRLFDLLKSSEPGSDAQLLFARSLAAHAHSPGQLDTVRGLLEGTLPVDGLVVDTEMRWGLLAALAAGGAVTEAEIDTELARDDTATGRVHAAAARAALPTTEAKERAWQQVVVEGGLPNSVQAAVIGGFGRTLDPVLLEPFVERYFDALAPIWQNRTNEMASQIVTGLYPTLLAGPDLLDRTDRWLDGTEAEPALRRLVVEARDAVVRALHAQDRDRASRTA